MLSCPKSMLSHLESAARSSRIEIIRSHNHGAKILFNRLNGLGRIAATGYFFLGQAQLLPVRLARSRRLAGFARVEAGHDSPPTRMSSGRFVAAGPRTLLTESPGPTTCREIVSTRDGGRLPPRLGAFPLLRGGLVTLAGFYNVSRSFSRKTDTFL
jgi:hypothetical protein